MATIANMLTSLVEPAYRRALESYRQRQQPTTQQTTTQTAAPTPAVPTVPSVPRVQPTTTPEYREILQQVQQRLSQPTTPFQYDPESDPAFQAQRRVAEQDLSRAMSDARVNLGARGMLGGSLQGSQMAQLQGLHQERLQNQILPQARAFAYQQYLDQQNRERQQLMDMLNLYQLQADQDWRNRQLGLQEAQLTGTYIPAEARQIINQILDLKQLAETPGISEREFNQYRSQADALRNQLSLMGVDPSVVDANVSLAEARRNVMTAGIPTLARQQLDFQQQQAELAQQNLEAEKAYRRERDSEEDRRWWANYERQGQQFAAQQGLQWAQLNQREREFLADQAYKQQMLELQRAERESSKMDAERRGLTEALRSGQVTPAQAMQQIDEDMRLGFYSPEEAQELRNIVQLLTPNLPSTLTAELTPEQQRSLPSRSELDRLYREQGQGYPELDWKSWYQSPNGRLAGLTFEQWQQLYGPSIGPRR